MIWLILFIIVMLALGISALIFQDSGCPQCGGEMVEVKGWPEKEQCADCKFTQRRW